MRGGDGAADAEVPPDVISSPNATAQVTRRTSWTLPRTDARSHPTPDERAASLRGVTRGRASHLNRDSTRSARLDIDADRVGRDPLSDVVDGLLIEASEHEPDHVREVVRSNHGEEVGAFSRKLSGGYTFHEADEFVAAVACERHGQSPPSFLRRRVEVCDLLGRRVNR